ncbi:MAG: sigma-70 family RNA polymerase sigma factor [Verrucomicrobiota bacterium]|nr:sigma-70 family RNA polymerase sigma factor [Verrucomicrobiota bacterium]
MNEVNSALSHERIAELAKNGDLAMFEELVRRFEKPLYNFSLHWCGNDADARELVQDVFVAAYYGLARYKPSMPFAPWLFAIARRKCIDNSRRHKPLLEGRLPESATFDTPSCQLEDRDEAEQLWGIARRKLSASQFQALWLHYAENMSVHDIARVMRRPQTYIKVQLFRARRILARCLKARGLKPNGRGMRMPARPETPSVPDGLTWTAPNQTM